MKDQQKNESDEIELGFLFKAIESFFKKGIMLLFLIIAFFQKYFLIVTILTVLGVITGYFLDSRSKKVPTYENHVIVIPNFESVDYLYQTVEGLNSKIASNDTVNLKSALGDNYKLLRRVEVEPIQDIYNFASRSQQTIDVFRILFQNQELAEFVEDMTTSKYFKYHKMKFSILDNKKSESIVDSTLKLFNKNSHFKEYQELSRENTERLIVESNKMITQVDSLINAAVKYAGKKDGNQSVFINDNSDLATLIFRKQDILEKRLNLLKQRNDEVEIIKKVSANYNILKSNFFSFSNKVKTPILFVLLFSGFFLVRYTYKHLKAVAEVE